MANGGTAVPQHSNFGIEKTYQKNGSQLPNQNPRINSATLLKTFRSVFEWTVCKCSVICTLFNSQTCSSICNLQKGSTRFITLRYLKDVILPYKEMYPGKHVGFNLDEAPAHMSKMIMDWVHEQEDWLTVIFIPGGLTSILQVGDLLCNHCPA